MMKNKYRNILLLFILLVSCSIAAKAQDDYKYEIGGMAGVNFYMGDANKTTFFNDIGPVLGGVFRYNIDLRWSLKANLLMGHISGDTKHFPNAFPFNQERSFKRMFWEAGTQIEFNFFSYSDQFEYLGTKRLTPYVFTGVGFTLGSGEKTFFDANIPIGIGMKYKLKSRLNLGFEFSFRRLFSDSFDVTKNGGFQLSDPYKIKSSVFKNKDWYSLTMFSVTWSFGPRECPCLNIE